MAEPDLAQETQILRPRRCGLGAGDVTEEGGASSENAAEVPTFLDIGYCVSDGGPSCGTPSPCGQSHVHFLPDEKPAATESSCRRAEFLKKQQSFEIQIEECEVEEISGESDGEEEDPERPVTPTQQALLQDFAIGVNHKEVPHDSEFLQVHQVDNDCLTDVSDAEGDD